MRPLFNISVGLFSLILLGSLIGIGWLRRESPTSGWLVFEVSDGSSQHVFRMDADGTDIRQLSPQGNAMWEYPQWSPDGRWILAAENTTKHMFALRPYGNGAIQAIDTDNFAGITMRWSPDSNQIMYTSFFERYINVQIAFLSGDPSTRLTNFGEYRNGNAMWSPNGAHVAFLSDRSGVTDIYQITIDGDELTRLTTDSNVQQLIAWSPDGTGLYYLDYLNRIVYIANDDSHAEKIVIQESGRIAGADLSSDGQWLVYTLVFREGIQQQQAAFEVRTDDGERRQILEDIVHPNDLVWSSDGEWLAFTAAVDDHQQIFRAHADGSQVEQLTFEPRNHTNPDWSPIIDKGWTWHSLPLILAALIGLTATSQLIPLKRK